MIKLRLSIFTGLLFLLVITIGCSSFWSLQKTDLVISAKDYNKMFSAYGSFPSDKEPGVETKVEEYFKNNKDETIKNILIILKSGTKSDNNIEGAIKAAVLLKAEQALNDIEQVALNDSYWFTRSTAANAIKEFSKDSSKVVVIKGLTSEKYPYVACAYGEYLLSHPVPGTEELLKQKIEYFKNLRFSSQDNGGTPAFLAQNQLTSALNALQRQNKQNK